MTFLKQLRVVIASPNDVKEEREALKPIIENVNHLVAEDLGLTLKAVRWETDSHPGFHIDGPQGLIDPILKIEDCDILIGIFWKRFGTPIKQDGKTGTEHEIYHSYESWKRNKRPQIMIYFNQKEYFPKSSIESEQQTAVLKFKENFPEEGLYYVYNGIDEFKNEVTKHLATYLRKNFSKPASFDKKTSRDYHSHSVQLVGALKDWGKRLRFTMCKYDSEFHIENAVEIPPSKKGFMMYMIKHLEKEEKYKPILATAFEIENNRLNLCKQIRDLLISDIPASTKPSFQKIILDKI